MSIILSILVARGAEGGEVAAGRAQRGVLDHDARLRMLGRQPAPDQMWPVRRDVGVGNRTAKKADHQATGRELGHHRAGGVR